MPDNSSLITVAMLNFNHANVVHRAIKAIKNQTLKPFQLIISDDCSTDNSADIITKEIEDIPWIKFIKQPVNLGNIAQGNFLLDQTKTDYVIFAASDDFLLPNYLERVERLIMKKKEIGLICAPCLRYSKDDIFNGFYSSTLPCIRPKYFSPTLANQALFKFGCFVKGATAIYNTKLLKKYNGFDHKLKAFADTVIAYQLANHAGIFYDPCPGAYCQRFYTGYASRTMRDIDSLESICRSMILKKELLNKNNFKSLIIPLFSRFIALIHYENYCKIWPRSSQTKLFYLISRIITWHTYLKQYSLSDFYLKVNGLFLSRINKLFVYIIYAKLILKFHKYSSTL